MPTPAIIITNRSDGGFLYWLLRLYLFALPYAARWRHG